MYEFNRQVVCNPIPSNAIIWNDQMIVCNANPGYFVIERSTGATLEHHNNFSDALSVLEDIED